MLKNALEGAKLPDVCLWVDEDVAPLVLCNLVEGEVDDGIVTLGVRC